MKLKLITICLLTFMSINVFAQYNKNNILTNFRRVDIFDKEKEEWETDSFGENFGFFEFNKDFTILKYTAASSTAAYMIKSYKYDDEYDQYEFDIVSDVGNKYLMIFDVKNNNLRFIYEQYGRSWLVSFTITKLWSDDDE